MHARAVLAALAPRLSPHVATVIITEDGHIAAALQREVAGSDTAVLALADVLDALEPPPPLRLAALVVFLTCLAAATGDVVPGLCTPRVAAALRRVQSCNARAQVLLVARPPLPALAKVLGFHPRSVGLCSACVADVPLAAAAAGGKSSDKYPRTAAGAGGGGSEASGLSRLLAGIRSSLASLVTGGEGSGGSSGATSVPLPPIHTRFVCHHTLGRESEARTPHHPPDTTTTPLQLPPWYVAAAETLDAAVDVTEALGLLLNPRRLHSAVAARGGSEAGRSLPPPLVELEALLGPRLLAAALSDEGLAATIAHSLAGHTLFNLSGARELRRRSSEGEGGLSWVPEGLARAPPPDVPARVIVHTPLDLYLIAPPPGSAGTTATSLPSLPWAPPDALLSPPPPLFASLSAAPFVNAGLARWHLQRACWTARPLQLGTGGGGRSAGLSMPHLPPLSRGGSGGSTGNRVLRERDIEALVDAVIDCVPVVPLPRPVPLSEMVAVLWEEVWISQGESEDSDDSDADW